MFMGIVLIIVGYILIIIRQRAIKQREMHEKCKKSKTLKCISSMLIATAFLIWMYLITDTLGEWVIVILLLLIAVGVTGVVNLVSNKLQRLRWILPTIVVPLAGIVCLGLSYAMISFTISKISNAVVVGIVTGLLYTVNQVTKENKKYRILMLTEVMILSLGILVVNNNLPLDTKPIRLIREDLGRLPENDEHIIISEDIEPPRRGKIALFRVYIEGENRRLEEMRYYNYVEGHITVEFIQKFNQ